jgi:hypothetical protein
MAAGRCQLIKRDVCTVHELTDSVSGRRTYRKRTSDEHEMCLLRREAKLHRYMNEAEPGRFVTLTGFCHTEEATDGGWMRRYEITTAHPGDDFVLMNDVGPRDAQRATVDVMAVLEALYRAHGFVHGDAHGRNVAWSPTRECGDNVRLLDLGMSLLPMEARFSENDWTMAAVFYDLYENEACNIWLYWHCYDMVICALDMKRTERGYDTLAAVWKVERRLIVELRDAYVRAVRRQRYDDDEEAFETHFWAAFVGADHATGRLTEAHLQRLLAEEREFDEKRASALRRKTNRGKPASGGEVGGEVGAK